VTRPGGNVFGDLGYSPRLAENLKMRADLMGEALRLIEDMTQVQAAALLGVSQPRISELKRGHIDRFTVDALVNMLGEAGVRVRISLSRRRRSAA
jgi:predicted XRE-type DNA-binding protein